MLSGVGFAVGPAIGGLLYNVSTDPLHWLPSLMKHAHVERLTLAESRAQPVQVCSFPLFLINDGGQTCHV